jgi:hypothetical protein
MGRWRGLNGMTFDSVSPQRLSSASSSSKITASRSHVLAKDANSCRDRRVVACWASRMHSYACRRHSLGSPGMGASYATHTPVAYRFRNTKSASRGSVRAGSNQTAPTRGASRGLKGKFGWCAGRPITHPSPILPRTHDRKKKAPLLGTGAKDRVVYRTGRYPPLNVAPFKEFRCPNKKPR